MRSRAVGTSRSDIAIVIRCFGEEARFRPAAFEEFASKHTKVGFVFANDSSTDGTLTLPHDLEPVDAERFAVLDLVHNRGKAEAVRHGMALARQIQPRYVGYWDTDLSTPFEELPQFVKLLDSRPDLLIATGSASSRAPPRQWARAGPRRTLGRCASSARITARLSRV
jgi:glycosyltransferase involved in cell wall biosynthesis